MAESAVFEFVCAELERETSLTALETRGTVRLALKGAGIDAKRASPEEMRVVLARVLPGELRSRGCADADRVCATIATRLAAHSFRTDGATESPEAVFARLGAR